MMPTVITPFELLGWAINRDTYVEAIIATNLAQWEWTEPLATKALNFSTGQIDYPPVIAPGVGMQIDELGAIPSKANPQIMIEGWHINFRVGLRELKDALEAYIATLPFVQAERGVPAAAMDANGMKWLHLTLADGVTPAIATRRRIWC